MPKQIYCTFFSSYYFRIYMKFNAEKHIKNSVSLLISFIVQKKNCKNETDSFKKKNRKKEENKNLQFIPISLPSKLSLNFYRALPNLHKILFFLV